MNAIEILIDRLKKVENELADTLVTVINDNNDKLEDAQREQMSVGLNSLNQSIGRLRNNNYANQKKRKGGKAPLGIADLKDTGDFYKGIKASATKSLLTITSTDSKKDLLIQKYSDEIFGYNQTTFVKVKDLVLVPGMIQDIKKQLGI